MELTDEEKSNLIWTVTEVTASGALTREDYIKILMICREACNERVREIDERETKGTVQ